MRAKDSAKIGEVRSYIEKEGPVYFQDLLDVLNVPRASLARYLKDLTGLGDIVKNDDGAWVDRRNLAADLRVYASERELRDARSHTKAIVDSVRRVQWGALGIVHSDEPEPHVLPRLLVLWSLKVPETPEYEAARLSDLVGHLRKGYRREFWDHLQEYAELQTKHAFPRKAKWEGLSIGPKHYFLEDVDENSMLDGILGYKWAPSEWTEDDEASLSDAVAEYTAKRCGLERELAAIPKRDVERARELFFILVGALERMVRQSDDGIPLKGLCDDCPHKKVRVTEKDMAKRLETPRARYARVDRGTFP